MANSRAFVALLVIPTLFVFSSVHAASDTPAGFAPGPVWISQSTPTAGTSVRLYTVVYNGSTIAIEGSVSFLVDGASIGSTPFSLDAGESAIESVNWNTTVGAHSISAEITSAVDKKTKVTAHIASTTTSGIAIEVSPALPKPAALEAIDTAQSTVASTTPIVQEVFAKTAALTEAIRTSGESYLSHLATASSTGSTTSSRSGSVLGAETYATDTEANTSSEPGLGSKVASVLLPIFKYPALFYPLFLFLLFFVLWLVAKRLRNPSRGK